MSPYDLTSLRYRLEETILERDTARRERDEWREWADHHSSWALLDAERPPDAELRARIGELCDVVTGEELAKSNSECAEARAERDAMRVALRDLVTSVEATKCRDTIVLRDIEAALAALGGQS